MKKETKIYYISLVLKQIWNESGKCLQVSNSESTVCQVLWETANVLEEVYSCDHIYQTKKKRAISMQIKKLEKIIRTSTKKQEEHKSVQNQ